MHSTAWLQSPSAPVHITLSMPVPTSPSRTVSPGSLKNGAQTIVLCPLCSRDSDQAGTHRKGRPQDTSKDLGHLISSARQCLSMMKGLAVLAFSSKALGEEAASTDSLGPDQKSQLSLLQGLSFFCHVGGESTASPLVA